MPGSDHPAELPVGSAERVERRRDATISDSVVACGGKYMIFIVLCKDAGVRFGRWDLVGTGRMNRRN